MKDSLSPKQKAKQLSESFLENTPYWDCRNDEPYDNCEHIKCALKTVKEIQKFGLANGIREPMMYWSSVEKELIKMLETEL